MFGVVTILDAVIFVVNVAGVKNNGSVPDCEPLSILLVLRLVNFTTIVFADILVIIPYLTNNDLLFANV